MYCHLQSRDFGVILSSNPLPLLRYAPGSYNWILFCVKLIVNALHLSHNMLMSRTYQKDTKTKEPHCWDKSTRGEIQKQWQSISKWQCIHNYNWFTEINYIERFNAWFCIHTVVWSSIINLQSHYFNGTVFKCKVIVITDVHNHCVLSIAELSVLSIKK